MTRYAVMGNPVAHSKSPLIHSMFARQTGEPVDYEKIQVEEKDFAQRVSEFFAEGGGGLNITVPHKEAAFALSKSLSNRAEMARAVNTLLLNEAGEVHGDNTDGIGLVRDIRDNHGFPIKNKKILILGAGGAARGALTALIEEQPTSITVVNRTLARALTLKDDFKDLFSLEVSSYDEFSGVDFDLVVNATSMSLSGEAPPISQQALAANCCCYDMMYGNKDTAFITWAKQCGVKIALDGLGMLVEQAAESFYLWRGVRPATTDVILALRENRVL